MGEKKLEENERGTERPVLQESEVSWKEEQQQQLQEEEEDDTGHAAASSGRSNVQIFIKTLTVSVLPRVSPRQTKPSLHPCYFSRSFLFRARQSPWMSRQATTRCST